MLIGENNLMDLQMDKNKLFLKDDCSLLRIQNAIAFSFSVWIEVVLYST